MEKSLNRSPASIQSKIRYLPFQQKIKKHSVNSNFFKIWSPEMSYAVGFIAADGNICHSGRGHVLHIACDDKDIIEKLKLALQYEGPMYEKNRKNGKISYSLRICDLEIFQDLIKLNITERKSLTLLPPQIPANFTRDYIRGYFDGDGSVSIGNIKYPKKLVVNFYSASKHMAEYLHTIIRSVCSDSYNGKIYLRLAHQKTPYYAIRLGHNAAKRLFFYMYKDASLYLNRKYYTFLQGV